ncbi:MAG: hypothetical protein LBG92_05150 [Prevotellaceae bacterium]|jgi:hypothetical protein|nr:hypothetical protein [Prevotellaceae bacterium]
MEELNVIIRLDTYHIDKKFSQEEFEIFTEQFYNGEGYISLNIPVSAIRDFYVSNPGYYSIEKSE